jgi:hypothetical protein
MAKNSTYRAVTRAGFNRKYFPALKEVMMISEPEAAAVYTARYMREMKQEDFLEVGCRCSLELGLTFEEPGLLCALRCWRWDRGTHQHASEVQD